MSMPHPAATAYDPVTAYAEPANAYAPAEANAPALPGQTADALEHIAEAWKRAAVAYLAEVRRRTGWERTPAEYGRYIARFLSRVDPTIATPADVHAFAYGIGASGKDPSASTISVRL